MCGWGCQGKHNADRDRNLVFPKAELTIFIMGSEIVPLISPFRIKSAVLNSH